MNRDAPFDPSLEPQTSRDREKERMSAIRAGRNPKWRSADRTLCRAEIATAERLSNERKSLNE